MGKILDFIVGNSFVFVGVIIALLATLLAVILSVKKSLNKRKIPIYEEIDENIELEGAKEEDVIEKPAKRSKKTEVKEEKIEKKSKKIEDKKEDKDTKKEKTKKKVSEIEEEIIIADEEEVKEEKTEKKIKDIKKELEDIFEEEPEVIEVIDEPEEVEEIDNDEFPEELEVEFDDDALREELEKIDDKEIEERIDEEHKKDIEDEIKDNDNDELKEILEGMKDNNEVDPEEVVRNFEEEQEAQSIISYQELLSVVKKRDADFEDELESRPLTTVSDFIKNEKTSTIEPEANVLELIEKLDRTKKEEPEEDIEELEQLEEPEEEQLEELEILESKIEEEIVEKEEVIIEKEPLPEIPDEGRFKKTDVISPVFGRIDADKKIDYPKVEKFDRRPKKSDIIVERSVDKPVEVKKDLRKERIAKEMQSVSAMFEDISSALVEKEKQEESRGNAGKRQLEDEKIESLSAISKNEDFLKALKDFRDSL